MSFSYDVKNELCRVVTQEKCCSYAELYGVLLYSHTFSTEQVRIVTENENFAFHLCELWKSVFSFPLDDISTTEHGTYILKVEQKEKMTRILPCFGYDPRQQFIFHLNFGLLEEECCRSSFLRGAFLAGGSITNPTKGYHLEFATSHLQVGREVDALLLDMGYFPGSVLRRRNAVTYLKQNSSIQQLLTCMGASESARAVGEAKREKKLRNSINRRVNCDAANLDKAVGASYEQKAAIERLVRSGMLSELPAKLQETAIARLLQPELTLTELAESFDPPITKSCLNHRMRKLIQVSKENMVHSGK